MYFRSLRQISTPSMLGHISVALPPILGRLKFFWGQGANVQPISISFSSPLNLFSTVWFIWATRVHCYSRNILNDKFQLIRFCPFHFRLESCVALVAWKFMGPKSLAPLEFSFKAQHRLFCTILGFLRSFLRQVEGLSPDRRPRYLVFVCADILCKRYKSFIMIFWRNKYEFSAGTQRQ